MDRNSFVRMACSMTSLFWFRLWGIEAQQHGFASKAQAISTELLGAMNSVRQNGERELLTE